MGMSDANALANFTLSVRKILDQCERATEQPIAWSTIQAVREQCRQMMLLAERMQNSEDDGR
jgi:hypothetical protein